MIVLEILTGPILPSSLEKVHKKIHGSFGKISITVS
jgi:hypothetical protein